MVFKQKRTWFAYVLWLFGGLFGLHLFYVGRDRQAFVYWLTLGGGFGCGWFRDMFCISSYVAEANGDPDCRKRMLELRTQHAKVIWIAAAVFVILIVTQGCMRPTYHLLPPFSVVRYLGQVVVAYVFGLLFNWSIPREQVYGHDLTWMLYLIPFAVTMGVHTVGNIGQETGSMKAPVVSSAMGASLAYFLYNSKPSDRLVLSCLAASSAFTFKSKQWRSVENTLDEKIGFCRRIFLLLVSVTLVIALMGSGLYFNAECTNENGERVKFRLVAADFLRSPRWAEFKESVHMTYNFYRAHGWRKILELIIENIDPDGGRRARKVLGLPSDASKQDIVARWRVLSKEWHPDRHRDPVEKAKAHSKFMEYQAAYQSLVKIRGKFKASTQPVPETTSNIKLEL